MPTAHRTVSALAVGDITVSLQICTAGIDAPLASGSGRPVVAWSAVAPLGGTAAGRASRVVRPTSCCQHGSRCPRIPLNVARGPFVARLG